MYNLLREYKLTGKVFDFFRIPKSKAETFLNSLRKEGWNKEQISSAFARFELDHKRIYPVHWRNSIVWYLKNSL